MKLSFKAGMEAVQDVEVDEEYLSKLEWGNV